jgi:hypothetical protein
VICLVLLAAVSMTGWQTVEYVEHDPDFCTTCHEMDDPAERWATSPHRRVECHTCHPGTVRQNLRQLWLAMTNRRKEAREHARVDPGACKACHLSNESRWKQVGQTRGHHVHAVRERIECTICHAPGTHVLQPAEDTCVRCHEGIQVAVGAMMGLHCLNCHDFLGRGTELRPGSEQCMRCHQGGGGSEPVSRGGFGAVLPAIDRAQAAAAGETVHSSMPCSRCHRPHGHVTGAGLHPTSRAASARTVVSDCTECHERERGAMHGTRALAGPLECGECHRPHEAGGAADERCAGCHREGAAAVPATAISAGHRAAAVPATATFAGHDRCTGCHAPHRFVKAEVRGCRTCHATQRTLGEEDVPAHAACRNCHAPHDPRGTPVARCQGYHSTLWPSHPSDPARGGCIGCHDPHPAGGSREIAGACSGCHEEALGDDGFHAGGVRCTGCHTPHRFTDVGASTCAACHGTQVTLASQNPGHDECTKCHEPHHPAPASAPRCGRCHSAEASTAPTGHRECVRCHEAHSGGMREATTCATCHREKAAGQHGNLRGAGCLSCHRPHGPDRPASPPVCTTCHQPARLPALHAVAAHQRCDACHQAHRAPRSDRATCLACHQDRRAHEPQATACAACHTFRR